MTAPAPLAPEIRALVLASLAQRIKAEQDKAKAIIGVGYIAGSKQTFRSPVDDAALGYVQRTDPAPEWRVTDESALRAHLATFPGCVTAVAFVLLPGIGWHEVDQLDEVFVVLHEHAPHLTCSEEQVTREAIAAAVEQSKATGEAAAPGITRVRPGGVLRVVPDKNAAAAITRLVDARVITWDGQPVLPAAESEAS